MHPLVRDLYKRVIHVGKDYPQGLDWVRMTWKRAIRNPDNCPSCYVPAKNNDNNASCERELRKAVGKGRFYVREMVAVIQFKKYRAMKRRYDTISDDDENIQQVRRQLEDLAKRSQQETNPNKSTK